VDDPDYRMPSCPARYNDLYGKNKEIAIVIKRFAAFFSPLGMWCYFSAEISGKSSLL